MQHVASIRIYGERYRARQVAALGGSLFNCTVEASSFSCSGLPAVVSLPVVSPSSEVALAVIDCTRVGVSCEHDATRTERAHPAVRKSAHHFHVYKSLQSLLPNPLLHLALLTIAHAHSARRTVGTLQTVKGLGHVATCFG